MSSTASLNTTSPTLGIVCFQRRLPSKINNARTCTSMQAVVIIVPWKQQEFYKIRESLNRWQTWDTQQSRSLQHTTVIESNKVKVKQLVVSQVKPKRKKESTVVNDSLTVWSSPRQFDDTTAERSYCSTCKLGVSSKFVNWFVIHGNSISLPAVSLEQYWRPFACLCSRGLWFHLIWTGSVIRNTKSRGTHRYFRSQFCNSTSSRVGRNRRRGTGENSSRTWGMTGVMFYTCTLGEPYGSAGCRRARQVNFWSYFYCNSAESSGVNSNFMRVNYVARFYRRPYNLF